MKTTFLTFFLAAAMLLAGAGSSYAWDDTGHKITAYIAWQRMTPEVREKVIKILREAPEDSQIASYYQMYGSRAEESRKREFFMLMATWADLVRDREIENRYKKYNHSNWHYSDTFWTLKDGKVVTLPAPEEGGKNLEKLEEFTALIRGNAADAQKAVAIAWIEHLVGDLHQPLHTSARVTEREPKGDQGGNFFLLTPEGTPRDKQENLHWFWDSIVVRNIPNSKDECEGDFIDPLAQKIMKKWPYAKLSGEIAPGGFAAWAKESLSLAQTDVFSDDLKRFDAPSPRYKKKALVVAERRLALAGYRMGDIFNSAFGQASAPAK